MTGDTRGGSLARAARKIICPGFGRTGTTTLSECLNTLGFRTSEVKGPWYLVKRIGGELVFDPDLEQAARFDAYADSPVPLVYRELADLYPGSHVILTSRDLDGWLDSTEYLMSQLFSLWRPRLWSRRGLFSTYNRRVFGAARFDRELYARSYERHYTEVREFFRGRSEPVLELDLTRAPRWAELCEFLGRPVPSLPFPHRNRRDTAR